MSTILFDPLLPQLALFALSSSLSPGPNNLLIATTGAWFGTRRTVPTLAGMYAGFGLMFAAACLGAAAAFEAIPGLLRGLQFVGAGYLVFLAGALLKATWSVAPTAGPLGFHRAALLQFVNPKLWLMVVSTVSLCTRPPLEGGEGGAVSVPLILFFVVMTLPGMFVYLRCGAALGRLAQAPGLRIWANRGLAALTAASATLLLVPI